MLVERIRKPGIKSWIGLNIGDLDLELKITQELGRLGIHYKESPWEDIMLIDYKEFLLHGGGNPRGKVAEIFRGSKLLEYIESPDTDPIFGHLDYNSVIAKSYYSFGESRYSLYGSSEVVVKADGMVVLSVLGLDPIHVISPQGNYIHNYLLTRLFEDDFYKQVLMTAERRGLCLPLEEIRKSSIMVYVVDLEI